MTFKIKNKFSLWQIQWSAWVFDLDDTLLDTSQLLIPQAFKNACEFLCEKNILESVEKGVQIWGVLKSKHSTFEIIRIIIQKKMNQDSLMVINEVNEIPQIDFKNQLTELEREAYNVFRTIRLPKSLPLIERGSELLQLLHQKNIPLFLVTQGDVATQMQKVNALSITSHFKYIYYIDPYSGESKEQAFQDIINKNIFKPEMILSVGNRLDNEIAQSKKIGMKTCYISYGEHAHHPPQSKDQIPDFNFKSIQELYGDFYD